MQIVICHLTRMQYPYICVAGIDLQTVVMSDWSRRDVNVSMSAFSSNTAGPFRWARASIPERLIPSVYCPKSRITSACHTWPPSHDTCLPSNSGPCFPNRCQ